VTKLNPENYKNCSSKRAYDCAQLQYTIQNRTGGERIFIGGMSFLSFNQQFQSREENTNY